MAKKKRPAPARGRVRKVRPEPPVKTDGGVWPYVEIRWHDATSESAWKQAENLPNPSLVITRGWLVRTTKVCVTVAASLCDVDNDGKPDVGEIITIPRGCIIPDGLIHLDVRPAAKRKVTLN